MPELPEVETVRIQLAHALKGHTIRGVEVFHDKTVASDSTFEERLVGKTFQSVDRVGKLLIFSFVEEDNLFILAHLKMTGQFFYVDEQADIVTGGGHSMSEAVSLFPHVHTRLALYLDEGAALYFNDMRLFGYVKLATMVEMEEARSKFGPEPTGEAFDVEWFTKKLRTRRTAVKAALLDQSFVAGLGNIYVDEALFRSGVRPARRADRVTLVEARKIGYEAGAVMNESIQVGGTTFQNFVDTGGKHGNFTDYLQVFGRQGQACKVCGTTIKKIRCAGRGTHFCPQCQK